MSFDIVKCKCQKQKILVSTIKKVSLYQIFNFTALLPLLSYKFSRFLYRAISAEMEVKGQRRNNMTVVKIFKKRVDRYPNKTCFFFEDQVWTYSDVGTKVTSPPVISIGLLFVFFGKLSDKQVQQPDSACVSRGWLRERRRRGSDDAQQAGVRRDLARPGENWCRHGADQHKFATSVVDPLSPYRRSEEHYLHGGIHVW